MAINLKKNKGFTLAELLVVITLIGLVFFIVSGSNLFTQILKARDSARKQNLSKLQKVLEEFYSDNNRYPKVSEIAYALPIDVSSNRDIATAGYVCGDENTSPKLDGYINNLPCDPKSPENDFVYLSFENNQKYAIFTNLEYTSDPDIEESGCQYGCSYFTQEEDSIGNISTENFYNFYVASSDVYFGNCQNKANIYACYSDNLPEDKCQNCSNFNCSPGYKTLYCEKNWCLDKCK